MGPHPPILKKRKKWKKWLFSKKLSNHSIPFHSIPSGILSIDYLGSGEMKALIWVTDGQELAIRRCKMDKIGLKAKYAKKKKSPGQQKDVPSWIGSHPQCLPAAYW